LAVQRAAAAEEQRQIRVKASNLWKGLAEPSVEAVEKLLSRCLESQKAEAESLGLPSDWESRAVYAILTTQQWLKQSLQFAPSHAVGEDRPLRTSLRAFV